jgi:hypothetical protein
MMIRLEQIFYWIATIVTLMMVALMLAIDLAALSFFALVVHHLVFEIGLKNWSSLGIGALGLAIIGGIWLLGNSFLDILAGYGPRFRHEANDHRTRVILPWLGVAAGIGVLFFVFGE